MGSWRSGVGLVLAAALVAGACAGDTSDEEGQAGEDVEPVGAAAGPEIGPAVQELGGFGGGPLGDFDLDRLLDAARTLDPEALCPALEAPESLDDVAEVLRIEAGCAIVEYVALEGRTVSEVRSEVFASDPTAHAVGVPPKDLEPIAQTLDYGGPAPDAYDDDGYRAGDWWHLDRLSAEQLWDPGGWQYTDDSGQRRRVPGWADDSEVIVAVLDTGTIEHRDLEASLVESASGSWLAKACHRIDLDGHGTHVAGLIAAKQGNSQGVAGLAPKARILPIHLLNPNRCSANSGDLQEELGETINKLTATQAVRLAAEAGARVINMSFRWVSFDGFGATPTEINDQGSDAFEAMLYAMMKKYNVVPVAAAGNCGNPARLDDCHNTLNLRGYPSAYMNVISVAATDRDDNRAVFSTSNDYLLESDPATGEPVVARGVVVAAPGDSSYDEDGDGKSDYTYSGILSTVPLLTCNAEDRDGDGTNDRWTPKGCGLSPSPTACPRTTPLHTSVFTEPGQCAHRAAHKSGTSMAAPLVSSVVAHMIARYPQAEPIDIELALINTADNPSGPKNYNADFGWGIVNPVAAIQWLDTEMRSKPDRPTDPNNTIPAVGTSDGDSPVSLAVGKSAQGWEGCSSQHCKHLQITLDAPAGVYDVACWSSLDPNGPWHSSTWHWPTSNLWTEGGCWFGFPGEQVWVTVNGRRSNTITWPSSSDGGAPGEVTGLAYDPATRTATWDPTPGTASYQINELILTDESRGGLVYLDIACCSYTITDLDITHVAVRAVNNDGEGPWSIEIPSTFRPSSVQRIAYSRKVVGIWVSDTEGTNPQQITSDVEDGNPSWSPNGTKIAFDTWNEIWVMETDGTNRQSLFHGGSKATGPPVWSPDSTRIAFRRYGDSRWEIWTTDDDGDNTRMLTEDGGAPSWSPDGTKILYDTEYDGNWVMAADGSDQQRLTDDGERPVWSPDGTKIAYDDRGIWVMAADGTDQQRLTDDGERPVWSPDGTKIAYNDLDSQSDSDKRVWVMDANGSNRRQLADNGHGVVWSPDGTKIFYRDDHTDIRWAINPDGTNRTQITTHGLGNGNWFQISLGGSWSPDGTRIIYENANTELWISNADGTTHTRLAEDIYYGDSFAWSPDGTRISYNNNGSIWVIEAAGNNRQRIADNVVNLTTPVWSPNGRKIAYANRYSSTFGIWVVEVNTQRQTKLSDYGKNPAWSPDSTKIAFDEDNVVWLIDPDGTNRTKLADDGENPVWSPDGSRLAFDKRVDNPVGFDFHELWVVNADGTNKQTVSDEAEYFYGYVWSPDSTGIVYVVADGIWAAGANGAQRMKLVDDGENPVWSPDGTRIAYNTGSFDRAIWTIDADGADQRRIAEDGFSPAWSSDGTKIGYETYDGTNSGAWVINADGTDQKRLTLDQAHDLVWSP